MGLLAGSSVAMTMPAGISEESICNDGLCDKADMPYERIQDVQAGYQWNDAGGYCGSWSIQRAALAKGAYISQQQVRDHTSPGGGHDNEILSTNIVEALDNLKLSYEGFDFQNEAMPQMPTYYKWLKKQLVAGNAVAWMIQWSGQKYPIYNLEPPAGMYGHVEPVIGIQSNHPLNDTNVYDDDVVVHLTDNGLSTVHRPLTSMIGKWGGLNKAADCGTYRYCMGPWGFGWAIKGFVNNRHSQPAVLHLSPWQSEPDTRSGKAVIAIKGTLTVSDLAVGGSYNIYRWDSAHDAFTYTNDFLSTSFQATNSSFVYEDPRSFQSDSTTYYGCVNAQ